MEKFVLSDASAGVIRHYIVDESTLPGVKYLPGCLWIEKFSREGSNSLFSLNDNSGKLKSGRKNPQLRPLRVFFGPEKWNIRVCSHLRKILGSKNNNY